MCERTRERVGFESIPENRKSELMWRRAADCFRGQPETHNRWL